MIDDTDGLCAICNLPTLHPNPNAGARAVHAQCLESGPGAGGYAVLDLETGGLDHKACAIVSAAVVVLGAGLEQVETWYSVVNETDKRIEDSALAVNGLTRAEIEQGMPVAEALEKIGDLMERRIPVCHNAAFDLAFLNARGFDVQYAIDTMMLAWRMWPARKAKLGHVAARIGVRVNEHHALGDALMAAEVLRYLSVMPDALKPCPVNFDYWRRGR